ncbi:MAG: LapA family protein [Patescibacteria group bacterium]
MLALLLYIVFGLVFGYFATLNTAIVSVHFGTISLESVPMYLLILLSFGIGVLFTTFFYLIKLFSIQRLLNKKDKESLAYDKEIAELTKASHKLEIENMRLKTKNGEEVEDNDSL